MRREYEIELVHDGGPWWDFPWDAKCHEVGVYAYNHSTRWGALREVKRRLRAKRRVETVKVTL